jgi:flavin reductase (DIM6/NTAB) family NADH-FMN oxidoreductase RutF
LDCRVVQVVDVGANTLFIAEVLAARCLSEELPLVYHNREYWKLSQLE